METKPWEVRHTLPSLPYSPFPHVILMHPLNTPDNPPRGSRYAPQKQTSRPPPRAFKDIRRSTTKRDIQRERHQALGRWDAEGSEGEGGEEVGGRGYS